MSAGFERLLRDALEADAAAITSHDLRLAAPPSGARPRRSRLLRRWALAPVGLAAAAAACWLLLVVTGPSKPAPVGPARPPATTTVAPTPTPGGPTPSPTASSSGPAPAPSSSPVGVTPPAMRPTPTPAQPSRAG